MLYTMTMSTIVILSVANIANPLQYDNYRETRFVGFGKIDGAVDIRVFLCFATGNYLRTNAGLVFFFFFF